MVVSADEEAVAGVAEVDMVLDERSALAPAPARSQGFGGEGIGSVGSEVRRVLI